MDLASIVTSGQTDKVNTVYAASTKGYNLGYSLKNIQQMIIALGKSCCNYVSTERSLLGSWMIFWWKFDGRPKLLDLASNKNE